MRIRLSIWTLSILFIFSAGLVAQTKRPMNFMDIITMNSVGSGTISPDGAWMLYTLTTTDWKAAKRFSDIYLVSTRDGVPSTRQMTFTKDKNETSPRWLHDSKSFLFLSNRESPEARPTQNQLYWMRIDGGEAMRISDAKDGVTNFAISKDGKWLAFAAGKEDEWQLWSVRVEGLGTSEPTQLTKHATAITSWQFSPDGKRIYFLATDSVDKANKERKEKKFDVRIRNEDSPPVHLWAFDIDTKQERRITSSAEYSVSDIRISDDSRWIGFRGIPNDRFVRTITEANTYSDLYLLNVESGDIERLTNNNDIGESMLSFSPDNVWVAFTAPNDFTYFRDQKIYIRRIADSGGRWKTLGASFDESLSIGFWSDDAKTIYSNEGWRATAQVFATSTETGAVTHLTSLNGVINVQQDDDDKHLLIGYSDSSTPFNYYTVRSLDRIGDQSAWIKLTDSNPQVAELALGETEVVQWKSRDGKMIEGVLVKPVGYVKGKRYPLIVQIHGGPAAASTLAFNASYGNYSHVYAGAGYACFLPNYRGSSNYGERFRMETSGDYFRKGFEDIMTGVDHLIATGLVDGNKLGAMGWSAGGHYSNWILTQTNRFKAISSGASAMNWISMYAQTDVQRIREFYFKGMPYDRFDHYWDVSPLKYIKNAKTPTLIHVVDGDPRVPRPQSEELHMALKKLGVPTEFFVYPGNTHGITEMRNQFVKMVSEFNWMEKWINGKPGWFEWNELISTLKEEQEPEKKGATDQ